MLVDARTMSAHVVETTCELSAFIKGGVMAASSERDAGFCSGGDEDDNMSGLHSPSASEDSVEVQVTPISLRNKRKLAEPRKIQEPSTAPLKKRRFEQIERTAATTPNTTETVVQDEESRPAGSPSPSPFRPWSSPAQSSKNGMTNNINNNNINEKQVPSVRTTENHGELDSEEASDKNFKIQEEEDTLRRHDESRWIEEENKRREEESQRRYEARIQEEVLTRLQESDNRHHQHQRQRPLSPISPQPLLLSSSPRSSSVKSVNSVNSSNQRRESRQYQRFDSTLPSSSTSNASGLALTHPRLQEEPLALVLRGESPRVPAHPAVNGSYERSSISSNYINVDHVLHSTSHCENGQSHRTSANDHPRHREINQGQQQQQQQQQHHQQQQQNQQQQRNYKNMTRERRIEANARERTRVHTISAAFDTLRRAIPAYSHNQKLSKLSVLRIACSYIMTLSKIANTPEGESTTSASLGACVDLVSRTIQTEGKLRKKKDE